MTNSTDIPDTAKAGITWIDPPTRRNQREWKQVVEILKTRPGEWANVGTGSRALQWKLSSGQVPAVNPDEFEVITASAEEMPRHIWMRYTGAPQSPEVTMQELAVAVAELTATVATLAKEITA